MIVGGVLLAAGMKLVIAAQDHLNGASRLHFLLSRVVEVHGTEWVVLEGSQFPTLTTSWVPRRVIVRIDALKRSLTFVE